MTGFIFDIKRFTIHDGPGIRTTVFFKGCPLHCAWCHNPESIGFKPLEWTQERIFEGHCFNEQEIIGRHVGVEELERTMERDRIFYGESGGGVTFSGGEPLSQTPFLLEILKHCAAKGIHTCVDTSGYAPENNFTKVLEQCNLLLFDLKHANEAKHFEGTGVSNQNIINNLKKVKDFSTPVWLRLPMVPDYNTDSKSWEQMLALLQTVKSPQIERIHLLPYHQIAAHKYLKCGIDYRMSHAKSLSKEELLPFRNQLIAQGWEQVYIGG